MTDTEIKDRIRKLLNVAQNDAATEGEIDNALRFAKQLMDKHHLDEADLVEEPADQWQQIAAARRDRVWASVGKKFYAWENHLACFAADFVGGVGVYRDAEKKIARTPRGVVILNDEEEPYKSVRFCFYGIAEDAVTAAELFHELRLTIRAMARLRWGTCYTKDGGAYAQGFVHGLFSKMKRANQDQKLLAQRQGGNQLILIARRTDLIERKMSTAAEWLRETTGIKLRKGQGSSGASGSADAWREGREDGKRTDVRAARRAKLED
jgi:hypothetical protein